MEWRRPAGLLGLASLACLLVRAVWLNTLPPLSSQQHQQYSFHPQCNCTRCNHLISGVNIGCFETRAGPSLAALSRHSPAVPSSSLADGTFVGPSRCSHFTTALGSGQKVLSYTYYTPWRAAGGRFRPDGRPNDQSRNRPHTMSARGAALAWGTTNVVAALHWLAW